MKLGDQNTHFFNQKTVGHRARNKILSLQTSNGERVEGQDAVKKEILAFYMGIFGTEFEQKRDDKRKYL